MKKKLGNAIIVGEEIKTKDGEVIGLFLSETIPPHLSIENTVDIIHEQKGLVYIPHPFEKERISVSFQTMEKMYKKIDIIETFNARSLGRKKTHHTATVAREYGLAQAASSDAHCKLGLGTAYCIIEKELEKETILPLLQRAIMKTEYAPLLSYACPFLNKIKHKIHI